MAVQDRTPSPKLKNRPPGLEALSLLSYAGSGLGFLLYCAAGLFFEKSLEIVELHSAWDYPGLLSPLYFFLMGGLSLLSLVGVFLMWNLRKRGFLLYTAAQTARLALPWLWLGAGAFSSVVLVFTLLFVAGYARYFMGRGASGNHEPGSGRKNL